MNETPEAEAETDVVIDASPDDVWHAITTPEGLAPWLGEGADLEPQPGGRLVAPDPVTGEPKEGEVHTAEEPNELGFTWWPADSPHQASDVTITAVPSVDGTIVRVVERPAAATVALAISGQVETGAWGLRGNSGSPLGLAGSCFADTRCRQSSGHLFQLWWEWRLAACTVSARIGAGV